MLNNLIEYIQSIKRRIAIVNKYTNKNFTPMALDMSERLSILMNKYIADGINESDIYCLMARVRIQYNTHVGFYYRGCIDTPFLIHLV